jgi:alpha-mannosidase
MMPGRDQIDVQVKVDWHEKQKMLKLRFPVDVADPKAVCEIPYGFIERDNQGHEESAQSWMDVSGLAGGRQYGVSILNDGKYSFDVTGADLGLTVLRSPAYAHHDPKELEEGEEYSFIDQGVQTFCYSIVPHQGDWRDAGTVQRAAELNQRPISTLETYHPGPLPRSGFFLSVEADNVIANSVKKAEEGDDLIVRLYETAGRKTSTRVSLPTIDRAIEVELGPCEIKTLSVPRDPSREIKETNLIEWDEV